MRLLPCPRSVDPPGFGSFELIFSGRLLPLVNDFKLEVLIRKGRGAVRGPALLHTANAGQFKRLGYFWLHTAYIGERGMRRITLKRSELDRRDKSVKLDDRFSVFLIFCDDAPAVVHIYTPPEAPAPEAQDAAEGMHRMHLGDTVTIEDEEEDDDDEDDDDEDDEECNECSADGNALGAA